MPSSSQDWGCTECTENEHQAAVERPAYLEKTETFGVCLQHNDSDGRDRYETNRSPLWGCGTILIQHRSRAGYCCIPAAILAAQICLH